MIGVAEAHWFCNHSIQRIWYHCRMSTGILQLQQASSAIASSRLSLQSIISSTKLPAEEVVPWETPRIVAVTTRRRVIMPCTEVSVDGVVSPLGAVKVSASVSDGVEPPLTTRSCLVERDSSSLRKAMVCCPSVKNVTQLWGLPGAPFGAGDQGGASASLGLQQWILGRLARPQRCPGRPVPLIGAVFLLPSLATLKVVGWFLCLSPVQGEKDDGHSIRGCWRDLLRWRPDGGGPSCDGPHVTWGQRHQCWPQ